MALFWRQRRIWKIKIIWFVAKHIHAVHTAKCGKRRRLYLYIYIYVIFDISDILGNQFAVGISLATMAIFIISPIEMAIGDIPRFFSALRAHRSPW